MAKLNGKLQRFPSIATLPPIPSTSSTREEHWLQLMNLCPTHIHPKSPVYFKVHAWFCTFYRSGQMLRTGICHYHIRGFRSVVLAAQSCPALCDLMDWGPSGSSVHGILQARILEWVAMPFSRGSSRPSNWTQVSWIAGGFLTIWATGKPLGVFYPALNSLLHLFIPPLLHETLATFDFLTVFTVCLLQNIM